MIDTQHQGFITLIMLMDDARRNGFDQMLADVATAKAQGVRLTYAAEEFVRESITR